MEALISTLNALPADVNRYTFLLDYVSPIPDVPAVFNRNLKAIEALSIITLVLCVVAIIGKLYHRSIFLFKIITVSNGKLLAWDTNFIWLTCILSFSSLAFALAHLARSTYVDKDVSKLLQFENVFLLCWLPLWTAGWAVTYGVLVASLVVLNPIWHLPKVPPSIYSSTGIFVLAAHWIVIPPLVYKTHQHTVKAVSNYNQISSILTNLAAQGTGYPELTGLDLNFVVLVQRMVAEGNSRMDWQKRQNVARLVFQGVMLAFLIPATFIYVDALYKQIFVVLPRLRGQVSRQETASQPEERPKLLQQGKQLRELMWHYALMLVEHIGILVQITCYTTGLACATAYANKMQTNGSTFNWLFSALFFFALSVLPFIQLFMACRAWMVNASKKTKRGSRIKDLAHHIRVDTVAEVVEFHIKEEELREIKTPGRNTPVSMGDEVAMKSKLKVALLV